MYGARHESLHAQVEGKYVCGSSSTSDFPLNFPGAEAAHCCFVRESRSFSVTRLNGRVWVNDLPVNGMNLLDEGDVISFGTISFRLEYLDAPIAAPQHVYSSSPSYGFPANLDRRAPAAPATHSAPAMHSPPKSIEIHAAAPTAIQDSSAQIALQKELLENQRLLSGCQQQLDELTQIIRERERHAESRLATIEERSSRLTSQSIELATQREQLAALEQDVIVRSEELNRQRQVLANQKREAAAEQNSRSDAAGEKSRSELSRREAELLALREQTLTTQTEQKSRHSELQAQHEEIERQRLALVEQQRELAVAAERNSQAVAAVESAESELSRREVELLALSEQTLATQTEQNSRNSELLAQHEEIERQKLALVEQQRELAVAAERNSQAVAAVESAESELSRREAELLVLQEQTLAAKAKLDQRESAVHELQVEFRTREELLRQRELEAGTVQEELQQLQQSNELRQSDLQKWQSEIESRADELAHRLVVLKSYRSEQHTVRVTNEPQTLASSESMEQELAAILKEREELDQRAAEIVAAEEHLAEELASAASITHVAESERTALLGANKELLCERNALAQLRQDLASRESGVAEREVLVARQLEDLRSRFAVLDLRAAEQKHYESEIDSRSADVHRRVQQLKKEQQAFRESIRHEQSAQEANPSVGETAEEFLAARQKIEKLQEDLNASDSACAAMVSEREELLIAVRNLQKALQDVRKDVEDAHRLKSESMLLEQRLEQARQDSELRIRNLLESDSTLQLMTEQLEAVRAELDQSKHERDELLAKQEEQSQISNTMVLPVNTGIDTSASRDTFSRELDQRAELLDRRDDELCERARRIEQSENDVESQRRQLLEARQQLEQARAEIQVALRQQSVSTRPAESATPEKSADLAAEAFQHGNAANDRDGAHELSRAKSEVSGPAADLRSELAGLFGLPKALQPSNVLEEMDLSEPSGENKSIAFRFGPNTPRLVEAPPELPTESEAPPAREENSDDFVRDYMEQLLSRSRKTAGTVLPGELKSSEKKSEPAAASAAEPGKKSAPKVTSFIDQYLAGNMGSLQDMKPSATSGPDTEIRDAQVAVEERPPQPRQKMDLQKLKENMDSFRTLSTQSVENALASHAIKVERHGFTGRTAFAAVLLTMTLILGIANAKGAIDYPMITWVTLTSAIAILSELHRRYTSIKSHTHSHTRNPLELLFSNDQPKVPVQNPTDMMADARPIALVTPASAADSCAEYDEVTIIEDRFEPFAASGSSTAMLTGTPVS